MESAVVGCLVTKKERKTLFIDAGFGKAFVLEAEGALGKPPGLGHFVDEKFFGRVGGLLLFHEVVEEGFERGRIFARDDESAAGEAVFQRIARRS